MKGIWTLVILIRSQSIDNWFREIVQWPSMLIYRVIFIPNDFAHGCIPSNNKTRLIIHCVPVLDGKKSRQQQKCVINKQANHNAATTNIMCIYGKWSQLSHVQMYTLLFMVFGQKMVNMRRWTLNNHNKKRSSKTLRRDIVEIDQRRLLLNHS